MMKKKSEWPINTKYEVRLTSKFKKQYRLVMKQGKRLERLKKVVVMLAEGKMLPVRYHDHKLVDSREFYDCRECHIAPDWLLVYRYVEEELILLLVETGTHSELFGK